MSESQLVRALSPRNLPPFLNSFVSASYCPAETMLSSQKLEVSQWFFQAFNGLERIVCLSVTDCQINEKFTKERLQA